MNKFYRHIVILIILLLGAYSSFADENALNDEYVVKGLLVSRTTRFSKWPSLLEEEFQKNGLTIGIWGDKRIIEKFTHAFKIEQIKQYHIKMICINKYEDIASVNLLFIPNSAKKIQTILDYTKNKPILTIGENKQFIQQGGIINFVVLNNNIKFEVNSTVANSVGIKISYLLLERALKVY